MMSCLALCVLLLLRPRVAPTSTLFPYTTLFRSLRLPARRVRRRRAGPHLPPRVRRRARGTGGGRRGGAVPRRHVGDGLDRKSTRLNSSHPSISDAVLCLKKKRGSCTHRRARAVA